MRSGFLLFSIIIYICAHPLVAQAGKVFITWAPRMVERPEEKSNSAFGLVDVHENYEQIYYAYRNNTKLIEDDHFSKKVTISQKTQKNFFQYQLIFRHWFVGELFRLEEKHQKLFAQKWWGLNREIAFPNPEKADMWLIHKYLMPETKDSWVGDNFKYMRIELRFMDLGENKTRLYFHIVVDSKGNRTLEEVKGTVRGAIQTILDIAQKDKKKIKVLGKK